MIFRTKFSRLLPTFASLAVVITLCMYLVIWPGPAAAQSVPLPTDTPGRFTRTTQPTQKSLPAGATTPTPTPISPVVAPARTPTATLAAPTIKLTPTVTPTPGPKIVTQPPTIRGLTAIVVDADTGRILYTKDSHVSHAQASTTKIITALTILKLYPTWQALQATTTVVQDDLVGEANMNLRAGERVRLSTLLLGLMTNSANEAGMALARYAGQNLPGPGNPVDKFVAAMNAYAASIGMYESHFLNPHGLDQPGHYSSAYDLALSGWHALQNPLLMQLAQTKVTSVDGHDFYNANSFLFRYPGATGLKPGWTDDAGRVLVATARNNGRNVLVVVMKSTLEISRDVDQLMDYGFTLLSGQAQIPLQSVRLGSLAIPGAALGPVATATPIPTPTAQPTPTLVVAPTPQPTLPPLATATPTPVPPLRQIVNVQVLANQMRSQLHYTLRLAANLIVQ